MLNRSTNEAKHNGQRNRLILDFSSWYWEKLLIGNKSLAKYTNSNVKSQVNAKHPMELVLTFGNVWRGKVALQRLSQLFSWPYTSPVNVTIRRISLIVQVSNLAAVLNLCLVVRRFESQLLPKVVYVCVRWRLSVAVCPRPPRCHADKLNVDEEF